MPKNSNRGVKMLGGFAPLALALLVGNAVLPSSKKAEIVADADSSSAAVCEDDMSDYRDCHTNFPTGCSRAGRYDAYLNLLKNSTVQPKLTATVPYINDRDFKNLELETAKKADGLSKGNHSDFKDQLAQLGEGRTVGIVAYLYYVQRTGAESSNCQLTGDENVDYHIGIGFDPELAAKAAKKHLSAADKKILTQNAYVVEMTPHYRGFFQPNWTYDDLSNVVGKQVRVEGQLLIDNEHYNSSQDCGMDNADVGKCWRASAWELHPVTRFQVCNQTHCDEKTTSSWAELEQSQEATVVASNTSSHGDNK